MRTFSRIALLLPLTLLGLAAIPQTGALNPRQEGEQNQDEKQQKKDEEQEEPKKDDKPDRRPAWVIYHEKEAERFSTEIEGSWILNQVQLGGVEANQNELRGFIQFREGFAIIHLELTGTWTDMTGNSRPVPMVQSGVHRYQIGKSLTIQWVSMMGFSSINQNNELSIEPSNVTREYDLQIEHDDLRLSRADGTVFGFRRVTDATFPDRAAREFVGWDEVDLRERPEPDGAKR